MKEGIFSIRRVEGVANKDSFELVKVARLNFKLLLEESKREGICIKWWDELCRQLCKNTQFCNNTIWNIIAKKKLNAN